MNASTLYIFCFCFLCAIYLNMSAIASASCGMTSYHASRVEPSALSIQGIELADYGYVMLYQSVLAHDETLFVLGATDTGKHVLSAISLTDRKWYPLNDK